MLIVNLYEKCQYNKFRLSTVLSMVCNTHNSLMSNIIYPLCFDYSTETEHLQYTYRLWLQHTSKQPVTELLGVERRDLN